jgi:hypothetical protein
VCPSNEGPKLYPLLAPINGPKSMDPGFMCGPNVHGPLGPCVLS